jgi:hypothetical protein
MTGNWIILKSPSKNYEFFNDYNIIMILLKDIKSMTFYLYCEGIIKDSLL